MLNQVEASHLPSLKAATMPSSYFCRGRVLSPACGLQGPGSDTAHASLHDAGDAGADVSPTQGSAFNRRNGHPATYRDRRGPGGPSAPWTSLSASGSGEEAVCPDGPATLLCPGTGGP